MGTNGLSFYAKTKIWCRSIEQYDVMLIPSSAISNQPPEPQVLSAITPDKFGTSADFDKEYFSMMDRSAPKGNKNELMFLSFILLMLK